MNIAICENDIEQLNITKDLINSYFQHRNIRFNLFCFSSGEEILKSDDVFDLAIMDVEMGEMTGIEAAAELRKNNDKLCFFFVTAHQKYLDSAMDQNILRFFEKPIDPERFRKGLDKAVEVICANTKKIYLEKDNELIGLSVNDIFIIEITGRRTKLITVKGIFDSANKIDYWLKEMPVTQFSSPHKSFLVNLNYVSSIAARNLSVTANGIKYVIPISPKRKKDFKETFFRYAERQMMII